MGRFRSWVWAAVALSVVPVLAGDLLRVYNTATKQIGALVDGTRGGLDINDERFLRLDLGGFFNSFFPVVPLDNLSSQGGNNEIIGFARLRPPILVPNVPWTAFDDTVDVTFDDEYGIPVTFWIVKGPFDTVRQTALNASVSTSMIWADERQGFAFSDVDIRDATDADPQFLDFRCALDAISIRNLVGYVPGRINVYYVERVDFSTPPNPPNPGPRSGVWCTLERIIAMGHLTSGPLLAHEMGHGFALPHTNGVPAYFDTTNVMHNSSIARRYLTEGQTFRAVYLSTSAINNIYDVRPGQPTRNCPFNLDDDNVFCPKMQKRLWADGTPWPPN